MPTLCGLEICFAEITDGVESLFTYSAILTVFTCSAFVGR